jgi:hypothetical protein
MKKIPVIVLALMTFTFAPVFVTWSAGTLKVTVPNGGQKWTTGKKHVIKWKKGNAGTYIKIQLLKSGKHHKWVSKKTKNDGKHVWKVPSTVKTGKVYKIKITSKTKKTVTDSSNKYFTITKSSGGGSLKVTKPNGGESWTIGEKNVIKWDKGNGGTYVKIQLYKSNKHNKWISKKTKNDGKHIWKIPSTVKAGTAYKIKITSKTKKSRNDSSNKTFTIATADDDTTDANTCSTKVRVGDPNSPDTYHSGKKVCLGKNPSDVVCATTSGTWATIKGVSKESLNIYACGSTTAYWVHGWDSSYCTDSLPGGWEIHPEECF